MKRWALKSGSEEYIRMNSNGKREGSEGQLIYGGWGKRREIKREKNKVVSALRSPEKGTQQT